MSESFDLPPDMAAILEGFDRQASACSEMSIGGALKAVRPPSDAVSEAQNSAAWAEVLAFSLVAGGASKDNPWRTYFGPMGWGEDEKGQRTYFPSLDGVGADFVGYWSQRADAVRHPVLKARYADLAWDFGSILFKTRPAITLVHTAIDAYLDGIDQGLHPDTMHAYLAIRRALQLAIRIRDEPRRDRARAALMALHDEAMNRIRSGERGAWWKAFRECADSRGAGFTDAERDRLVADVESVFALGASPADPKRFDPHDAKSAAESLIRHYRARGDAAAVKRLQKDLAQCLEHFAGLGDAMLATSTLPEVVDLYRDAGLPLEARRVQRVLQEKVRESRALMGQHEFVQKIPKEEMEAWLAGKSEGGLDQALLRIALEFMTREAEMRQQIADTAKAAPLFAMITKTLHAEDHVAGTVGNAATDETGALLFEASRWMQLSTFWLFRILDHVIEQFGVDAGDLVSRINASGLFEDDTTLLQKGIQAWLDEDHIQAVHLLIPQIERGVRALVHAIGQPVTKPHREVDGVSQAIGIGDALHDPEFARAYGPDLRFHLMALYADPRGWNLRNRLAHGLLRAHDMDAGQSVWLIQTLLLLGISAIAKGDAPTSAVGH